MGTAAMTVGIEQSHQILAAAGDLQHLRHQVQDPGHRNLTWPRNFVFPVSRNTKLDEIFSSFTKFREAVSYKISRNFVKFRLESFREISYTLILDKIFNV